MDTQVVVALRMADIPICTARHYELPLQTGIQEVEVKYKLDNTNRKPSRSILLLQMYIPEVLVERMADTPKSKQQDAELEDQMDIQEVKVGYIHILQ
jgi:hypothetical protein